MPSGDAQKTWFPELVEILRKRWHPAMPWDTFVGLSHDLDAALSRIRAERNILPPLIKCRKCGKRERAKPPRVSVRAAILALGRFGIAEQSSVKDMERSWRRYRKANHLDLYGSPSNEGES